MNQKKLQAIQILKDDEEYISSDEFLKRGRKLTKGTMDKTAFDFYSKKENWHLLPPDTNYLYFVDTEFCDSDGCRCVRFLYRDDAEWIRDDRWLIYRFGRDGRDGSAGRVAMSAGLEPLELESAIKICKEAGYKIYKDL